MSGHLLFLLVHFKERISQIGPIVQTINLTMDLLQLRAFLNQVSILSLNLKDTGHFGLQL